MGSKVTDPALLAELNGKKADDETTKELNRLAELDKTREAARQVYADMSPLERFGVGVARPVVETVQGIKSLFTDLTPEEQANLARLQEVSGGAGTAGRVVGELAMFAAPGGAATKGATVAARALPRAMARFAPLAADVATVAGMEALKAPTEDRSRAQAAVEGSVGALAGAGAGKVLRRALGGVRATPQAEPMLAAGVPLTPGMAAGGPLQRFEQAMSHVPVISGPLRQKQRAAVTEWNRKLLNDVVPEGQVTTAGHEGFKQVTGSFNRAYDNLWSKPLPINPVARAKIAMQRDVAITLLPIESAKRVSLMAERVLDALDSEAPVAGRLISHWDDQLRTAAKAASRKGDYDEARALGQLRDTLREALPADVAAELARLDGKYREFATMRKAASYKGSAEQGGIFTPNQLMSAAISGRGGAKNAVSQGRAPLQQEASTALKVIGDIPAKPGVAEKLTAPIVAGGALMHLPATVATYGTVRAAFSEPMRRFAIGGTPSQEAAIRLADELRKRGIHSAYVGAALEE